MSSAKVPQRDGISRTASIAAAVIIIVIIAAIGGYLLLLSSSSTTSSSTSSSTSSLSSTSSASSFSSSSTSATSTTSSSTGGQVSNLVIDAWAWPVPADLNELYAMGGEGPWPNYLMYSVYQPLISINQSAEYGKGVIQYLPGLAQNWTTSADGKTYTLNLRQNVNFSDGNPFNAYQVWFQDYGYYYLSGNSSNWWINYNVFDMSNVSFGQNIISTINSSGLVHPSSQALAIMENSSWPIYVTGQYQIVYRLKVPFIWFPGTLVAFQGLIYDAQWALQHGGFGTPTSVNSYFNTNPIPGTGPYVVTSVSENAYVKFSQDPNYWGRGLTTQEIAQQPIFDPGHAKNVVIYYKADDLARYTDLSTGAAQIADIESSDWNLVTSNPQYSYVQQPSWGGQVMLLGLNAADYPTNLTLVRQAIVHAINYTDLYNKAYLGLMSPYVGPEYPAWSQFYNLGNNTPYQYNITLAKQDIAKANVSNMPVFLMRIWSGCDACTNAGQVIQSDLAQIGITVNLEVLTSAQTLAPMGNYATNVANAAEIGQLSFVNAGSGWGPGALTPADYWQSFVSNESVWGNYAAYYNPVVQSCVNAFSLSNNITYIQNLCTAAQKQIYNDAPYAWIGVSKSWIPPGGSTVYNKNVVTGFLLDPLWGGESSVPFINTVTFAS